MIQYYLLILVQCYLLVTAFSAGGILGATEGGQIGGKIGGQNGGVIETLTDRQKEILSLIKVNNRISYEGIAIKLSINESAVAKHMKVLREKRVVERENGKRGWWKILIEI